MAPTPPGIWAQGLSAVAARMEPREAAATLTQAMTRTNHPYALQILTKSLSDASARLEPKEVASVSEQADALLTTMTATKAPFPLRDLAMRLSELAVRLEPRQAARVSAQAAACCSRRPSPGRTTLVSLRLWRPACRRYSAIINDAHAPVRSLLRLALSTTVRGCPPR